MPKVKTNKKLPIFHPLRTAGLTSMQQLTDSTSNELFAVNDTTSGTNYYVRTYQAPKVGIELIKESDDGED
jgi:hypothetical protein